MPGRRTSQETSGLAGRRPSAAPRCPPGSAPRCPRLSSTRPTTRAVTASTSTRGPPGTSKSSRAAVTRSPVAEEGDPVTDRVLELLLAGILRGGRGRAVQALGVLHVLRPEDQQPGKRERGEQGAG